MSEVLACGDCGKTIDGQGKVSRCECCGEPVCEMCKQESREQLEKEGEELGEIIRIAAKNGHYDLIESISVVIDDYISEGEEPPESCEQGESMCGRLFKPEIN